MNVKIQSVKFDADQKLVDFIQLKLSKIGGSPTTSSLLT